MKLNLFAGMLCAVLPAVSAQAEYHAEVDRLLPLSLEELMAIPARISTNSPKNLRQAPSVVSVITREDILATGAHRLLDVLQAVPGIYVKPNLFGYRPLITMRGAISANVLLMIDGAPVKDLVWSHGIFWKGVAVERIERIEIIRGPGSAVYGTDASAGVINVITRTAEGATGTEVGGRVGSYATRSGWVQHGGDWQGVNYSVFANLAETDGHRPYIQRARGDETGHARYGWKNEDLHFSLGSGAWRVLVDHTRHHDVEIGLTGAAMLDPDTRAHDRLDSLALLYANPEFAERWELHGEMRLREMHYSSGNGYFERIPLVYADHKYEESTERRFNAGMSAVWHGWQAHEVHVGVGYMQQDLRSFSQLLDGVPGVLHQGSHYTFLPTALIPMQVRAPQRRSNHYVYVQDIWRFARDWELTTGIRRDHYSDFGNSTNPRLALVWQATPILTGKLMYGQAFRAPGYLERYITTAAAPPNPSLQPEKSRTWELSLSWLPHPDLRFVGNLYRFDRRNVIAPDPRQGGQYFNHRRFLTRGIELEAQWQAAADLRISGNLAVLGYSGLDHHLRDLNTPHQQAYLRADWNLRPGWHWNVQANWYGRRSLPEGDERKGQELGSRAIADTTLRYRPGQHWELAASVRNLFDTSMHEYSSSALHKGLPWPGRNYYIETRYRF